MSNRHPLVVAGLASLVVAALATLNVVRTLAGDRTGQALLLGAWLLLPYVVLAMVLVTRAPQATAIANAAVTLLIVAGGLVFLVALVFVSPDPQGGIAVMFTPIYQGIAILVLVPLARWLVARSAPRGERDAPDV